MPRPVCPGDIATDVNGSPVCYSEGTTTPISWASVPEFDIADLDQAELAGFFAAGFVMVGIAWAIGLSCQIVVNAIRRW